MRLCRDFAVFHLGLATGCARHVHARTVAMLSWRFLILRDWQQSSLGPCRLPSEPSLAGQSHRTHTTSRPSGWGSCTARGQERTGWLWPTKTWFSRRTFLRQQARSACMGRRWPCAGAYFRTPGAGSGAVWAERAGNFRGCWRGCTGAVKSHVCPGVKISANFPLFHQYASLLPAWQVLSVASVGVGGEDVPGLSSRRGSLCGQFVAWLRRHGVWTGGDALGADGFGRSAVRGPGTGDGHAGGHAGEHAGMLWGDGGFVGASR